MNGRSIIMPLIYNNGRDIIPVWGMRQTSPTEISLYWGEQSEWTGYGTDRLIDAIRESGATARVVDIDWD